MAAIWNWAKLYRQVFGRKPTNPIFDLSDLRDFAPIDRPGRSDEWSPLGIIVVVGIGLGILWWLVRPHSAFVIFVQRSRIDRVRGDAARPFLMDVDDICREFEISQGTIRQIGVHRFAVLLFSPGIPKDCPQRIRNTWRVHL